MPTYEYRCSACGQHQDIFQKMSDPPATQCPACGKPNLERLISASAFALKGSGWYADGYGAQAGKEASKAVPAKADAPAATPDAAAKSEPAKTEAPKSEPAPKPAKPET
jgi:putative FmdB family regulatory protein